MAIRASWNRGRDHPRERNGSASLRRFTPMANEAIRPYGLRECLGRI